MRWQQFEALIWLIIAECAQHAHQQALDDERRIAEAAGWPQASPTIH